jgi:hypothetical protein
VGRGLRGRDDGGNVNNVQYKSNGNCQYEYSLYNEYFLIKIYFKKVHEMKGDLTLSQRDLMETQ